MAQPIVCAALRRSARARLIVAVHVLVAFIQGLLALQLLVQALELMDQSSAHAAVPGSLLIFPGVPTLLTAIR